MQSSKSADNTAFIGVCFFANGFEVSTIAPIKSNLDQLFLDAVNIVILSIKRST